MNASNDRHDEEEETAAAADNELDPRIHIELEKLNNATDEINRLEMELDDANATFRILMADSMRKLKSLVKKLGSCIDRARPYYEALEIAKQAQLECQQAAVKFQRANEIHQAAKETVALAENRFLSNRHEWEFDSAWQEMLNNAIMKVTEAEHQKAESGREHQRRATLFHAAEQKVQSLEQHCRRHVSKSRPFFEEKTQCDAELRAQKEKVLRLRASVAAAKNEYAACLRRLENISDEIHHRRRDTARSSRSASPRGPREPGVGAERDCAAVETAKAYARERAIMTRSPSLDLDYDLSRYDVRSMGSGSMATSSGACSEVEDFEDEETKPQDLEELRQKVRELATRPVVEPECCNSSGTQRNWETELNVAVQKLDDVMHLQECEKELTDNS